MRHQPINSITIENIRLVGFIFLLGAFLGGCVHEPIEGRLTPEQAAARADKSASIHTELAGEYYHRGQYRVALEEVNEALKSSANYAPAFSMLGLIYMALNEDDKAHSYFDRALRSEPGNSEIRNNYGWFLCERYPDQMDRAVDHFMAALKDPLYETRHVAYANAGLCELKRNNFSKAALYFRESLSLQPVYRPALVGLIEMDFKEGKIAAARSKLAQFMQAYQPTARSLWLGIQIEQASGNARAADSYRFQLQKNYPNSRETKAIREGGF
ncbi:MAG: type IV pilus biogenesis/stability protein PilW [Burkholderiales bacterium]|nr:type IV pilus biogenesis/stability protein PilW [Nitrosomonas sp.]MCP5275469.1 type IV pilus biogenesis/stability protein PilW [Burkholderiales bacterium]